MGPTFVLIFLGVFALAIGQALLRRRLNPYGEVAYGQLDGDLRSEIERVLPGFRPSAARVTKRGDEARVEGDYLGQTMRIEADFDRTGALVEFEVDGPGGFRTLGLASPGDLPEPAAREIDRVLGGEAARFEARTVKRGTSGSEPHFEVDGTSGDWKWEIVVSAAGRLREVEKEKRRGAR